MSEIELVPYDFQMKLDRNIRVFRNFISRLRHPVMTENDYLIASMNILCYRADKISLTVGEVMLITDGYGIGNIRIVDGGKELLCEDIYDLLEDHDRTYSLEEVEEN